MADGASATTYWADEREQSQLIKRCLDRYQWHLTALDKSGRWSGMFEMLSAYYGAGTDGMRTSRALRDAEDDDTVEWHINQVRPVIANAISLVCGQWPKVKPRARNEGAQSLAETRLALRLHEAYQDKSSGKSRIIDTIRGAWLSSSWSLGHAWAPQDGKEWDVDEAGQPIYEGDAIAFVLPPWRCVYDFAAADESSRKWVLFRRPTSRWDTAANVEQRAKSAPTPEEQQRLMRVAESLRQANDVSKMASWKDRVGQAAWAQMSSLDSLLGEKLPDEDVVWVWELRHRPTPALPLGRLVRFVEPDVVLWDSYEAKVGYPYDENELHVREYAPERVVTGTGGHTSAFDLGAMQEFFDLCTTSMASTINVNGQNRFWSGGPDGAQVRALGINGAVIESEVKPEVLEFPALKQEVVAAADWAAGRMRESQALNDVVMGQPDKGMPAQAMALLKATALQYHAVSQGEFVRLVKWDANSRLRLFKRFARTERVATLVGKGAAYELKKWSQKDIAGVEGFEVEEVDPASDTREARQAMAELLVQRGLMTPEAYLAFIQTGNLEQGLETKTAQKELIESNVELLQSGVGLQQVDMAKTQEALAADPNAMPVFAEPAPGERVVRILKSDPHHLAVPAYLAVLTSPASRDDAKRMQAALEAVQLSLQYWASLTPDEAMAYGIPPLPSQMAAMGPPPGAPPDKGAPPDESTAALQSGEGMPEEGAIEQPKDPTTGEQVPGAPQGNG